MTDSAFTKLNLVCAECRYKGSPGSLCTLTKCSTGNVLYFRQCFAAHSVQLSYITVFHTDMKQDISPVKQHIFSVQNLLCFSNED